MKFTTIVQQTSHESEFLVKYYYKNDEFSIESEKIGEIFKITPVKKKVKEQNDFLIGVI